MKYRNSRRRVWLVLLATAAAVPTAAQAQDADGLNEIVVTAQKRQESMQDVPISISAVSGEAVDRLQTPNLTGLQGEIPNVQIGTFSNTPNSAVFTIRGIGVIDPDPYAGQTVSIVLDGVPQYFNMVSLLDLFDVERIEILRGPQGTLFGANTTGGVINVVTAQPTGEFGLKAKASIGNYGRMDVAAAVNLGLVEDVLAGKVSYVHNSRDGYFRNTVDGRPVDNLNVNALRGSLKFTPGSNFDATLTAEYDWARNGPPLHVDGSRPGEAAYVAPGVQPPGALLPQPASPCIVPNEPCKAPDRYLIGVNDGGFSNRDVYGLTLAMNLDLGATTLTSITGYKKFTLDEESDQDGSALLMSGTRRTTRGWQLSQELRADINATDSLNLLIGGFAMKTHYRQAARYHIDFLVPMLRQDTYQDQGNWSASAFAQAFWQVSDRLRLQGGLRFTHERTRMNVTVDNYLSPPITYFGGTYIGGFDVGDARSWNNLGGKLGFDWQATDDVMLYGYYAHGFKSGGFVGRLSGPEFLGPYDPESVDTVEAGVKADLLDRHLRLNLSLFHTWYKDMQLANLFYTTDALGNTVNGNTILNAGAARIKGFEFEATARPIGGLELNGTVAYLDAKYRNFDFVLPDGSVQDLRGYRLQNAPRWSATLGFRQTLELGNGRLEFGAKYKYTGSKYNNALNNTPRAYIQPTHIVDASAELFPVGDHWSIELWGRNLFDKRYMASVYDAPGVLGLAAYTPPREYGLTAKFNW